MEEIKDKLIQMFRDNGWYNLLKSFLNSEDFTDILIKLQQEVDAGIRFTPPLKLVFKAFNECPYDKLKVVFVGTPPANTINESNGLLFGSDTGMNDVNKFVIKSVRITIKRKVEDTSLVQWANQGVLLLNVPLTVRLEDKPHKDIWLPFVSFLLDMLSHKKLIFVLVGKDNRFYETLIKGSTIFYTSNPISAKYTNNVWDCYDVFNKINFKLKEKIIW